MNQLEASRRHCGSWRCVGGGGELNDALVAFTSTSIPVESDAVVAFLTSLLTAKKVCISTARMLKWTTTRSDKPAFEAGSWRRPTLCSSVALRHILSFDACMAWEDGRVSLGRHGAGCSRDAEPEIHTSIHVGSVAWVLERRLSLAGASHRIAILSG